MRGSTSPFTSTSVEAGQVVAEVRDAARIDLRSLRDVGHEHLNLDDVLGSGAGRLQALVHCDDGNVELGDDIGGNAAVVRLTDDASDPNVGACASDVAVVANGCWDIGNDDLLNLWYDRLASNLSTPKA